MYKIKKIFSNLRNYIEENQNKFGKYKSWVDWSFYRCKLSLGLIDSMKIKYEKKNIKDYPSNYQYYLYMIDYYFLSKGSVKASKIEYRRLYESTKGTVFEKIFERFSKKERVTRKELYLLKLGLFDYHLK